MASLGRKWLSPNFNPRSPRGGATSTGTPSSAVPRNFNPRSPRGGATANRALGGRRAAFQSTLPTRGSDALYCDTCGAKIFQSTLPTRGSDIKLCNRGTHYSYFNPRSPRGGATRWGRQHHRSGAYFNPRSPRGGATYTRGLMVGFVPISIHAPHEGERLARMMP